MSECTSIPTDGSLVRIDSSLIIPHLICHYDEYLLMTDSEKKLVEEYEIINRILHDVHEYMYDEVIEYH